MNREETIKYVKEKLEDPAILDYAELSEMLINCADGIGEQLSIIGLLKNSVDKPFNEDDAKGLLAILEEGCYEKKNENR